MKQIILTLTTLAACCAAPNVFAQTDIPASFSYLKECHGVSDRAIDWLTFRPKVVYIIASNYSESSKIDGAELKKEMKRQLKNFVNSNDKANFLSVVFVTDLPSWPSDRDFTCDKDGPVFPYQNNDGRGIFLCRLKYSTKWNCAEIESWNSTAVRYIVDEYGNKMDGTEICQLD